MITLCGLVTSSSILFKYFGTGTYTYKMNIQSFKCTLKIFQIFI